MYFAGAPGIRFWNGPRPGLQFPQSNVPLPRIVGDNVPLGSVFDQGDSMVGTRELCWGSNVYRPGLYGSWYWPSSRDNNLTRQIDWYLQNQPDWVIFCNDRATVFQEFFYSNKALVTLNIQNPAVRAYQLSVVAPHIAEGHQCIAFDNVDLPNNGASSSMRRAGVWIGATFDQDGVRVPGTGTWQQLYAGVSNDPAYSDALIDYIGWFRRQVNFLGAALMINGSYLPTDMDRMRRLQQSCDIWLTENAPAHGDNVDLTNSATSSRWSLFYDAVVPYTLNGGVWFNSQQFIGTNFAAVPQREKAWMVANFLLMRGERSYFSADQSSTYRTYDSTWLPQVGYPAEQPHRVGNTWQRRYTNGYVYVHPYNPGTETVTVPAGSWKDQFGTVVAPGDRTMTAKTGLVLVAQP